MKRILILLAFITVLNSSEAQWIKKVFTDSKVFNTRKKKNKLTIFSTNINMFNGEGMKKSVIKELSLLPKYISSYPNFSYIHYLKSNYFFEIKRMEFRQHYMQNKDRSKSFIVGDVIGIEFKELSFTTGRQVSILNKKLVNINIPIALQTGYRYGLGEAIYLGSPRWFESRITYNIYKSFGIGAKSGIEVELLNRVSIGAEFFYSYYFEKSRVMVPSLNLPIPIAYDKKHIPNRKMLGYHIKIGVLF